jgi:hypothetical protein
MKSPETRAGLLLRWYPAGWRSRYGAEFTELLVADQAAAASWVLAGPHGPGTLFRPGAIDVAAMAAMALALVVGWQALRRTALR